MLVFSQGKGHVAKQPSLQGTRCTSCISLSNQVQFPASLQNYSNQPATSSSGNQGWSHSWHWRPASHSLWLSTLFLCGPAWCDVPRMRLINCCQSRVSRPVSRVVCSAVPITRGQHSLLCQQHEWEGIRSGYVPQCYKKTQFEKKTLTMLSKRVLQSRLYWMENGVDNLVLQVALVSFLQFSAEGACSQETTAKKQTNYWFY